jgi:DNA-binding transcriptional MocR family regulator
MSLLRREQLVTLARKYNALIITDDVYDQLQWPTNGQSCSSSPKAVLPRLSDIDRALEPHSSDPKHFGHTMSNGSFSKILGPGVRTGWVDAMPALSYALSQCGSSRSGGCPSQFTATIVSQLVVNGELEKHIATVLCPAYQKRWELMMVAIEKVLVPLGVIVSRESLKGKDMFGGYFIWFELPNGVKAENVAIRAKEREELIVAHGGLFEVYGDEESVRLGKYLRVCFAWEDESNLVESIERLGRVIETIIKIGDDTNGLAQDAEGLRQPLGEI